MSYTDNIISFNACISPRKSQEPQRHLNRQPSVSHNLLTFQQNKSEEDERKRIQVALDEARRTWKKDHDQLLSDAINNAQLELQEEINVCSTEFKYLVGKVILKQAPFILKL